MIEIDRKKLVAETPYGARIRLIHASPIEPVILAFKTSTGRITSEEKLEYYMTEYRHRKRGQLHKWFRASLDNFPSILEHMYFTFFIDGVSRIVSHQLVRHRHVSYIQESLRYSGNRVLSMVFGEWEWKHVDRERFGTLAEGWYKAFLELPYERKAEILDLAFVVRRFGEPMFPEHMLDSIAYSVKEYMKLLGEGYRLEMARYVLPMSIRTRLTMTGNLRGILSMLQARTAMGVQNETRMVALAVKELIETYLYQKYGFDFDILGWKEVDPEW